MDYIRYNEMDWDDYSDIVSYMFNSFATTKKDTKTEDVIDVEFTETPINEESKQLK